MEREHMSYGTTTMDPDLDMDTGEDYEVYRSRFFQHYETSLANTGYPYDYYDPAYRFGYGLAGDDRYSDRDWMEVEPEFRREWERERPGTWEGFKSSVRHAWEEVKDAFR
jgi:hypothetical protein